MKRTSLAVLVLSLIGLRAEGDDPLAALAKNYTQMREVPIAYEALISSELTPHALQDPSNQGPLVEPKWKTHVSFCADKVGFYIDCSRLGKEPDLYSYSYNGSTYETFLGPDKVLEIATKSTRVPPALWNSDPLTLPAAALAKSHNEFNQLDCLWTQVTDSAFWQAAGAFSAADQNHVTGLVNGDKIVLIVSDKNAPPGFSGWESYQGTTDKPWMKYTCSEMGQVSFDDNGQKAPFFFPRKAVLQRFDETGQLVRTDIFEITKLEVNDPGFKEARFTVDPASVAHTYDLDSKKWLKESK